jgi:hypothetical protein
MIRFLLSAVALVCLLSSAQAQDPQTATVPQGPAGFLYLEQHRVRYEVLVPMRQLDAYYPVSVEAEAGWTSELQAQHKSAIAAILQSHMHLSINGRESEPQHSALVFFDMRAPMQSGQGAGGTIDVETGAVGMIVYHATPPGAGAYDVDAAWDGFNALVQGLPVTIFSDAARGARLLTPRHNRLLAQYRATVEASSHAAALDAQDPVIANDADAAAVLERILTNIHRAFDYARDEDIYDALARSVTGELLSRVYLDIRGSLAMEQEGGATARVERVQIVSAKITDRSATTATIHATWRITGTVEHWGHIHQRTNEYTARVGLERQDGRHFLETLAIERHDRIGDEYRVREVAE